MFRFQIALDPIKKIKNFITRDAADYVQAIHISKKVGISEQLGDVDVYVKNADANFGYINDDHAFAYFLHLAISTKRLFITADPTENGNGAVLLPQNAQNNTRRIECVVGVYGTLRSNHRGKKFGLSFKNRTAVFWNGIAKYRSEDMFQREIELEAKREAERAEQETPIGHDPDNPECVICTENKKNALLQPCRHMMTCENNIFVFYCSHKLIF